MSRDIAQFLIPVPNMKIQEEIVALLLKIDQKQEYHQHKRAALTALFRTLLHQLMTAQIRVHDLDLPELV